MEWNKGVAVEREEEEEEDGGKRWHRGAKKKSGAARNTKEGHTRPSRICVQDGKDRRTCLCILIASCKRNGSFDPMETNKRLNNTKCCATNSCIAL